jgi:ElaB/YqjD/DUF883 family membrane-anchored ribosome-binding protein
MAAKRKKNGTAGTKSAAVSGNLGSRLDALVADLEALQGDVRGLAQGAGAEAGERITEALRMAEDRVAGVVRAAEEAAAEAVDQAEVWATDNLENLREQVREQPVTAMVLALSAGALLGAIFLRR